MATGKVKWFNESTYCISLGIMDAFNANGRIHDMRKLGIAATLCSAIAFLVSASVAWGGDALPAPPYIVTGSNHVFVGVKWDEAELRAALPEGIEPVPEMIRSGHTNISSGTRRPSPGQACPSGT